MKRSDRSIPIPTAFSPTATISGRVFALALGIVFTLGACGNPDDPDADLEESDHTVINGTTVTNETEGVVMVTTPGGQCSGTLMTNRWVLTSKHCVEGVAASDVDVLHEQPIGTWTTVGVGWVGLHSTADVALLQLSQPFTIAGSTYSINNVLSLISPSALVGKTVTCYGYGVEDNHGTANDKQWTGAGTLRSANLTVSTADDGAIVVDKNASDQTLFHGDSGGPCFYYYNGWRYQVGIVWDHGTSASTDANPINAKLVPTATIRDWVDWYMFSYDEDLGGGLGYSPAATSLTTNRLEVFGVGSDGAMWTKRWSGSTWVDWTSLGGAFTSGPASAKASSSSVMVFGRGTDNAIWVNQKTSGSWSGWSSLGGVVTSSPAATSSGDGNVWLFAVGTDSALWYRRHNGSSWTSWYSLGGTHKSDPSATSFAVGDVHVFSLDGSMRIQGNYATNTTWNTWAALDNSTFVHAPVATSSLNNRIDLFVQNANGTISYRKWYGAWQPTWNNLGYAAISDPDAASWGTGRMDVVFVGAGSRLRRFSFGY